MVAGYFPYIYIPAEVVRNINSGYLPDKMVLSHVSYQRFINLYTDFFSALTRSKGLNAHQIFSDVLNYCYTCLSPVTPTNPR